METILKLLLIAFLSYLVGSIPSAVIISKKFFGFDIRERGSGNMGSTNAFRILGWKWGLVVQILDILKGVFAILVIANVIGYELKIPNITWFEDITLIRIMAGIFAVAGHIWPIYLNFRGGKGINTAFGMLLGIAPLEVGIAVGLFLLAVFFSGYISLGSLVAAVAIPITLLFRYNILHDNIPGYGILIYFTIGLAGLVVFTHRSNIGRLLKGTENKFAKLHIFKCKSKNKVSSD